MDADTQLVCPACGLVFAVLTSMVERPEARECPRCDEVAVLLGDYELQHDQPITE